MLYQGERPDWFDSQAIYVMALVSAVALPLLLVNEWFDPLPLLKFQLLGRRNIAYGFVALFTFEIVALSGSTVPVILLSQVQGYRPEQSNLVTLTIALPQLVLLPTTAYLLDVRRVDSRLASFVGYAMIVGAFVGSAFVDYTWTRDQLYPWQA